MYHVRSMCETTRLQLACSVCDRQDQGAGPCRCNPLIGCNYKRVKITWTMCK